MFSIFYSGASTADFSWSRHRYYVVADGATVKTRQAGCPVAGLLPAHYFTPLADALGLPLHDVLDRDYRSVDHRTSGEYSLWSNRKTPIGTPGSHRF